MSPGIRQYSIRRKLAIKLANSAVGLSYAEICELTGWSYTKVNRCLVEGRAALREWLARAEA